MRRGPRKASAKGTNLEGEGHGVISAGALDDLGEVGEVDAQRRGPVAAVRLEPARLQLQRHQRHVR